MEWSKRTVVSDDFLADFRIHLIDKKLKELKESNNYNNCDRNRAVNNNNYIPYYEYIEKLLQKPIHDFRKLVLWRILCPYLVNIKKLPYDESYAIIRTWLDNCNTKSGRPLDFNADQTLSYELKHVKNYFPLGLKRIKTDSEFKKLYEILKDKELIQ